MEVTPLPKHFPLGEITLRLDHPPPHCGEGWRSVSHGEPPSERVPDGSVVTSGKVS
mgnify:CR=1 FL=1